MTTKHKPKPKGKGKRGGQPGNKNALKHGFYSKGFTADEISRLDNADALDVTAEVHLNRVMIDRLQAEISFDAEMMTDNNTNQVRNDHYLRQLNTLAAMTAAQATLVRTQYLIKGKAGEVQSSILAALEELRLEMGL
jgi:hypothetical protein